MRELVEQGIEIDGQRYDLVLATGARKHGDFLFAHVPYWKKIAPTFEKIMAYGGIMLTSCREPSRQFRHLRVLIVKEDGEYGTGDCNAKMAGWLFEEFGQRGHRFRTGQFRLLAEREDGSGLVVVGKGTIKRMDHQDVDERGQPYDLILPESALKGNSPGPGEYVWDTAHLGFNAWSERCRVRFSYQYLQWLSPDNIRALFPRLDGKVEILKEAMTSTEGARKLLRIARKESPEEQDRELEARPVPELLEALAGQEMDEEEEFRILDTILAGDRSDVMVHHPYVRHKLRQIMRRVWHDLAIGGGVEVPSFTWQPDSFRDKMDWIPLRHIVCPELPDGEVASFRCPIRTRHDLLRVDGRYGYVSLTDDSTDVWRPEWFDQLANLSEVVVWGERERLPAILGLKESL